MIAVLLAARAVVSMVIVLCVGLAFLPHTTATGLTGLQKFLTKEIERRRG